MSQSVSHSFIESVTNVTTGYFIAIISQMTIFPAFGIEITLTENFTIAGLFTVISVIRSFFFRRVFNSITVRINSRAG